VPRSDRFREVHWRLERAGRAGTGAGPVRQRYLDGLIDSHTAQTLASRAFNACHKYSTGLGGRPRFKRRGEIASIEGKGPTSPLQWKDDHIGWGGKRRDRRLVLRPIFDKSDRQGVEAHALSSKIKYVRLLRRRIKGDWKLFVQLVCEVVRSNVLK
jgi:putative transposase